MNVSLSTDLVVPAENLFRLDLDELKRLEQRMFMQVQQEYYALTQIGPATL